jgi:PPOX class probable F420-dependent enzyme
MAEKIEGRARELLEDRNFVTVATLDGQGRPQLNVVWGDADDDHVILNTEEGRAWPANLRRDPRVTLVVVNGENPYEYAQIRGRVVEDTHDGAREHIDKLAKKYLDADEYPAHTDSPRIIFRIEPESVRVRGG